jgi:gliding motility-associated-like protein
MKSLSLTIIFLLVCISAKSESISLYEEGKLFAQIKKESVLNFQPKEIINSQVYIKFNITKIEKAFKLNEDPLNRVYLIEFVDGKETNLLIDLLIKSNLFEYVEQVPKYLLYYTPNDLQIAQWNLKKILAENSWNIKRGNKNVVIGIVDDAMDTAHSDIEPVTWKNKKEIRNNGVDDDGNGYVDDYIGWDFADNDNDPTPGGSSLQHGTHCAGIAGAATDNSNGIASIGFGCQLMIAKIGKLGYANLFNPYLGVEYAIINKVKVISMSWGGGGYSNTYQLLFDKAYKDGIVCVAAAGNSSSNIKQYPACYNHVISVGSTTNTDLVSSFSNYGTWIDVMAPGSSIYSTLPGNKYGYLSGTSMACPLVSGLCALMFSKNPYATPDEIEACLKSGCTNITALNSAYLGQLGAGRINAENSLKCLKSINAKFTSNVTSTCPGDTVKFFNSSLPPPIAIKWKFTGGTPSSSFSNNPKVVYNTSGSYDVELVVFDSTTSDTFRVKNYISIAKPTATLSLNRTIISGTTTSIRFDFTGNAPFKVTLYNDSANQVISNINHSPYYHMVSPTKTTKYTIVSYSDSRCVGTYSGISNVTVAKFSSDCKNGLMYQGSLGAGLDDLPYGLSEDDDKNIYISGNTTSYGNGDGFFAKFNSNGDMVWFKTYGGNSVDLFQKHIKTPDNGFLILGSSNSYGVGSGDAWIVKVDSSGSVLWSKTVGGSAADLAWDAVNTNDNGYLVYGNTRSYGAGDYDNYLIKLDKNGNLKWTKVYGNPYYSLITGLTTYKDGSIIFCSNYRTSNDADALLTKVDSLGNHLWSNRFGGSYNDGIQGLAKGVNGDVVIVGYYRQGPNQDMLISCFNSSGTNKWNKVITGSGNDALYAIQNDGIDFIVTGHTDTYGAGSADISLIKFDTSGNIIFAKAMGGSNDEISLSCLKSKDEGYYTVGYTKSFSNGNNDIFINKFSCKPAMGCNEIDYSPPISSYAFTMSSETPNVTSGGSLNSQTIFAIKRVLNVNYQCKKAPNTKPSFCMKINVQSKISSSVGGFTGTLANGDGFGSGANGIGDIDNDGVPDIAVSAALDDDGSTNAGAIWILFMKRDGSVRAQQKISATQGGFSGTITNGNYFGNRVVPIGDLNSDGIPDIAVSHHFDNTFNTRAGAIWILFLNLNGTVKSYQKITSGIGGFAASLQSDDRFGFGLECIGDFDKDGIVDLIAGAQEDKDAGTARGAFYILYLKSNGTVKGYNKISATQGNFGGSLKSIDRFGFSLTSPGDINGDGVIDFVVGARDDADGGTYRGAIWILFMNANGTVNSYQKNSSTSGNLTGIKDNDQFGQDIRTIDDLDYDGIKELAVSAAFDDDGGADRGAIWIVYLNTNGTIKNQIKMSSTASYMSGKLDNSDLFGYGVGVINDLNNDGFKEIIGGSYFDDDGGTDRGAVYLFNIRDTCPTPPTKNSCRLSAGFSYTLGCVKDTIKFIDASIDSAKIGIVNWKWSFGDGGNAEGSQIAKHVYTNAGNYLVKLIVYLGGNVTCSDTLIRPMKISNQLRILGLLDDTICRYDSANLGIGGLLCGTAPFTYSWQPSAGLSNTKILNPKASPVSSTQYILTITDKNKLQIRDTVGINVNTNCCKSYPKYKTNGDIKCEADTFILTNISTASIGANYNWRISAGGNYSSYIGKTPPPLVFKKSGVYQVSLILNDLCGTDTFRSELQVYPKPKVNAGIDTILCKGDSIQTGPETIGRNQYRWTPSAGLKDSSSAQQIIHFNDDIKYTLRMVTEEGCIAYDTITIGKIIEPILNIGSDTSLCSDTNVIIKSNINATKYLWNTGSNLNSVKINTSGTYWLEIKNKCVQRDTVKYTILGNPIFTFGDDTTICNAINYTIVPNINVINISKKWNDGTTNNSIIVNKNGLYWLNIDNGICSYRDSINVYFSRSPFIDIGNDTLICSGDSIVLDATDSVASSYKWNDGNTNAIRIITNPGKYTVTLSNSCGTYSNSITLNTQSPPIPFIGDKIIFCLGDTITLNASTPFTNFYLWDNGSVNPIRYITSSGKYTVKTGNICGNFDTSVSIEGKQCECEIYIPNTFTPINSTGVNDEFKPIIPQGCEPIFYKFDVYNRWGELVFTTNDYNDGWKGEYKGKKISNGNYVWIMTIQHPFMNKGNTFKRTGNILIIE